MVNLTGPSYDLDSRPASVQRTVNMMPVPIEPGNERAGWFLRDVPGLDAFGTPLVACIRPVFTIIADPASGVAPLTVAFSVDITDGDGPFTYLWDFGDDTASTAEAPEHTYSEVGTYTVSVIVSNTCGDSEATTIEVEAHDPSYVFRDTFSGLEDTAIADHTPDVAPDGFTWTTNQGALVLTGSGGLVATGTTDGAADSESSSPALNITLDRPYSIEITATPYVASVQEFASFRVTNEVSEVWAQVGVRSQDGGDADDIQAIFTVSTGTFRTYSIDATQHTVKATFYEDGTADFLVDGVVVETFTYTPPTAATRLDVVAAREDFGFTTISEVNITQGALA